MTDHAAAQLAPYLAAGPVKAHTFKPSGKWAYEVTLDYGDTATIAHEPSGYIDHNEAARHALAYSTYRNTSEVSFRRLPAGYSLVVFDAPGGVPVHTTEPSHDLVWIRCTAEVSIAGVAPVVDYVSVPRVVWEGLSSSEQDTRLTEMASETLHTMASSGASVVDEDDVPVSVRQGRQ